MTEEEEATGLCQRIFVVHNFSSMPSSNMDEGILDGLIRLTVSGHCEVFLCERR